MNIDLYIGFLIAAAALIALPGPTVMLVVGTSLRKGAVAGLVAVAGSTAAAAIQLLVVLAGLASVVVLAGEWFEWLRWIGVAYLFCLGIKALATPGRSDPGSHEVGERRAPWSNFTAGFLVTLTNPKTLFFLGAFLPQFVDPALPVTMQLVVLSASFLFIAGTLDSVWAIGAAKLGQRLLARSPQKLVERASGAFFLGAGTILALAKRSD